ncbi:SusC/RagA family TonB-linked outer membrane protein [Flammeovirga kamogawensis]|uniref:TonB-dependent receptor n=1 Tax=Flammeovirga kamogawensis TaxID=373891 RepID=A0ABX8GV46_9BACT|nr:TonB-dependent receptor [Flammeovirga kamogawensis]MBB6459659.1 TonB-linked SusC/RagA family outer membrane protein [Flammeovirga kamogawensis]QWG07278.1 TonB-dependent receptor [Flammeovirga kamogawensis]TRX69098.1 TonB-dependent receptor [Flammeovirga kamogawensis]
MLKLLNFKSILGVFLFAFMSLTSTQLLAQDKVLTGTILGEDSAPLPGVNVQIKGTTTGTVTNFDGKFSLNVEESAQTLVFSFIGYLDKEMAIGTRTTFDVSLEVDAEQLEEVVVVGYGVQKKSLVTGAIASVDADDIVSSAISAEQALQGKAAGVTVTPQSGSPGNGIKIRIRGAGSNGNSDPLYIVDGMKTGNISFLSPSDIASMEVLKDAASSAIYGSEGANGVVIITTKGGKKGAKSSIDYSFQYGIQTLGNNPQMMNAQEYAQFMQEAHQKELNDIEGFYVPNPNNQGQGTNFLDAAAQEAPMMSHNLSFSGGSDKGSYLLSAGYTSQDGVIGGDKASYERINGRLNLTRDIKDWIDVSANIAITNSKRATITEDDAYNGLVNAALLMDPTAKARYAPNELTPYMQEKLNEGKLLTRDQDGNYYGVTNNDFLKGEIYNPLTKLENARGVYTENKILTTGMINLKPVKGLKISSRIGFDIAQGSYNSWNPSFWANSQKHENAPTVTANEQSWSTWMWENFATYNTKIGKSTITGLIGVSAQENNYRNLDTKAGNMVVENNQFRYPNYVTSRDNDRVGGGNEMKTLASYFARVSYDYDNRYIIEATFRRDGSSLFGSENKWGTFPSVSVGWNVSNESFWNISAIDYLKVRGSWGQNGSLSNLQPDQYRSLIRTTGISYPGSDDILMTGAEPEVLANPNLKWETSEQTNIGIDLRALDSKIYFTADYYKKLTKDLLTTASPALSQGNYAPYTNAGTVSNEGLELILGYRNSENEFTYDVSLNGSFNKNEVVSVPEELTRINGASLPVAGTLTYFEEGFPVWYYRGFQNEGIFRDEAHIAQWKEENKITNGGDIAPGDPIVKDINGDGEINDQDVTNIGSPHPTFIYGANISAAYKGFDLNIFLQGATGHQNYIAFMRADNKAVNRLSSITQDRWRSNGDNASYPRADYLDARYFKSDLLVQDASYLKIRQIQLGYTLPSKIASKALLSRARVYVSLNDFFTFTNYDGVDPEIGSKENNAQGVDFGTYPVSRKLLFGLAVTF